MTYLVVKKLHKFGYENCHVIVIIANPRNLCDEIINKGNKEELEKNPYKEILESIQFVTIGSRLNNSYSIGSAPYLVPNQRRHIAKLSPKS
jgi:hypothetical protein